MAVVKTSTFLYIKKNMKKDWGIKSGKTSFRNRYLNSKEGLERRQKQVHEV